MRPILEDAGIHDDLIAVLHSHELGHGTPAPELFAAITDASGYPPAEILYVGARARSGVFPALRTGLQAALIAPSATRLSGQAAKAPVISHLRDLPELIDQAKHRI